MDVNQPVDPPGYEKIAAVDIMHLPPDAETKGKGLNGKADSGSGTIYPSTAISSNEKKTENLSTKKVGFFELFRFADGLDIFMMIVGSFCALAVGASFPTNVYFFGDMITHFVVNQQTNVINASTAMTLLKSNDSRLSCYKKAVQQYMQSHPMPYYPITNVTATTAMTTTAAASVTDSNLTLFHEVVDRYVPAFCGIALGVLVCAYVAMALWVLTAERQILRIRLAFFRAIMKQDVGWFDTHQAGELNTRLADDMDMLHEGFGDKMATFLQWMATFVGGFIIGLVQGWKLALVIMAITPVLVAAATILGRVLRTFVQKELKAYAKAGAVATEVFTAIRTVAAFGGQAKAIDKYKNNLAQARREGIFKSILTGVMGGVIWFIIFSAFALAYWYGAKLVRDECLEAGVILQVFFGVLIGAMSLGQAAPILQNFSNARGAASVIFDIIDTPSKIDSSSDAGLKPTELKCDILYQDIHFAYPARSDVQIMKGLSLSIKAGQTVALVGPSGCGKSTLIQLLQRFYDPLQGAVILNGMNIKDLNLHWLRGNVGVVGQEPVLFDTTIEDNIKLGGTNVTTEDVIKAAKLANCFDFISKMPQKFQTLVGERGAQLSGGQKQRIAIARAIVGNPKILLLDEATSALDTESEAQVQAALEKAREGRTTIVVAHRLSTVRNADVIFALREGRVVESGTHAELIEKQGLYYSLHAQQQAIAEKEQREKADLVAFGVAGVEPTVVGSGDSEQNGQAVSNGATVLAQKSPSLHSRLASPSKHRSRSAKDAQLGRLDPVRSSLRSLRDSTPTLLSVTTFDPEEAGTEEEGGDKSSAPAPDVSMSRIIHLNKPEMGYIIFGCFAAMLSGIVQPAFAIIMSEIFGVFGVTIDPDEQEAKIAFWAGMMVVIGAAAATVTTVQSTMFAISGERLTERLRLMSFSTMLKQEMGWFDEQENQVGVLTAKLAMDASSIKGAIGDRAGVILQAGSTIVAALVISFAYVWELTVVVMWFFPLTMAGGLIQGKLLQGYAVGDKAAVERGGKIAQEVISNIRTVLGLNKETYFVDKFSAHFNKLYTRNRSKAFVYGIAYSCSQCIVFFAYAVCFSFGAYLVDTKGIKFFYILRVFSAITFGGMSAGRATAAAPDYAKAKVAANKLFQLFDRKSLIDYTNEAGIKMNTCEGRIKFSGISFRYPTRPTAKILRDLSVEVGQGERLALVGASGCGKSTAVAMVERFYDPLGGSVTLDGNELQSINIQSLRKQLGIVSQEPILFDDTIAQNIAYGDNTRTVSMDEIMEAARKANIHNFVSSLPQGYETNVGDKGTQLSGGQKQRIAIARALLRNPHVLLLDEATSALDTESEKVVQEALNKAQEGRTCIIIAHRLSTIRNATKIGVIYNGCIAELGSHEELIARKGLYYNLINVQLT